jgi:uncharacterized protein (UPF0212 family)
METVYKCASCYKITSERVEYVYVVLGQNICPACAKEREYEIDQIIDARI